MSATAKIWLNDNPPTLDDDDLNGFKLENNNLIVGAGLALSTTDNQQTHLAVSIYAAGGDYYTEAGTVNNYVLSTVGNRTAPPDYFDGQRARFEAGTTNTGSAVAKISGLANKTIYYPGGAALPAGAIPVGDLVELVYSTSLGGWQLVTVAGQNLIVTGLWSFNNGLTQFGGGAPGDSWSAGDVLEIGATGSLATISGQVSLGENAYFDGVWKYQNTDFAARIILDSGEVHLQTAASGTADTAVTWVTAIRAESDGTVKGLGGNWLISPNGVSVTPARHLVLYESTSAAVYTQYANVTTGATSADGLLVGLNSSEQAIFLNQENSDMLFSTNSLTEMYLDASNRGLVVGAPTGAGQGAGAINAESLHIDGEPQQVFSGSVLSPGTAVVLPTGWSSSRTSTGFYVITHNLGLAASADLIISPETTGSTIGFAQVTSAGTNSFTVKTYNSSLTITDINFTFVANRRVI